MAYPAYIREKALSMRRERKLTIDEISQRLALPRTTIYYWVRDIPIDRKPGRGWSKSRRKGTRAMREKYLRVRELAYNAGRHNFHALAEGDPTFRDFVSTFIGEGYKRNRNRVAIGNSDPAVVELATRWMRRFAHNKLDFGLQYHADQDPTMLCEFWGNRLGVEPESIRLQRKSNSNQLRKRTWRSQFGVMTAATNDTRLRAMMQGWVDEMKVSWLDSNDVGAWRSLVIASGLGPEERWFESSRPDLAGSKNGSVTAPG